MSGALSSLVQDYGSSDEEGATELAAEQIATPTAANGQAKVDESHLPKSTNDDSSSSSSNGSDEDDEDDEDDREEVDCCCICGKEPKYRCPACERRTCSLRCCNAHKEQANCSGKRPRSLYADSKSSLVENVVYRDYCFLEETARLVGQAERERLEPNASKRKKMPLRLQKFIRAATEHRVDLRIMPDTFSKRTTNTSFFNEKSKTIEWHTEWIFARAEASIVEREEDTTTPLACFERYLSQNPSNTARRIKLGPYVKAFDADPNSLAIFMRIEGIQSKAPLYVRLDPTKPFRSLYTHARIVEHPTLHVALPSEIDSFPIGQMPGPAANHTTPSFSSHPARGPARHLHRSQGHQDTAQPQAFTRGSSVAATPLSTPDSTGPHTAPPHAAPAQLTHSRPYPQVPYTTPGHGPPANSTPAAHQRPLLRALPPAHRVPYSTPGLPHARPPPVAHIIDEEIPLGDM
jgi:hypothetical protein